MNDAHQHEQRQFSSRDQRGTLTSDKAGHRSTSKKQSKEADEKTMVGVPGADLEFQANDVILSLPTRTDPVKYLGKASSTFKHLQPLLKVYLCQKFLGGLRGAPWVKRPGGWGGAIEPCPPHHYLRPCLSTKISSDTAQLHHKTVF